MTIIETRPSIDASEGTEKTALGRAQLIIDAFTPDDSELSLSSLARRTGLPKSTAHRFVEQMISLGWLERRLNGYRIGVKLYEMGEMCARRNNLCRAATNHLTSLAQRTGRSVYLSVLDGPTVLSLHRTIAPGIVPTRATRRIRFPVLTTVFGRSIVAFESETEIDDQIAAHFEMNRTRSSPSAMATMREELLRIRETGYAIGPSSGAGVWFMGIPLRNSGRPIASISVNGPKESLGEGVAEQLQQVGRAIWHDLFSSSR